jgi:hypothetical protein
MTELSNIPMTDPDPEDDDKELIEITTFSDPVRKYIQADKPQRVRLGDPIELDEDDEDDGLSWELWPDRWE